MSDHYPPGPPPPPPSAPGPWQGPQPGYGYPPGYGYSAPQPPVPPRRTWVYWVIGGGFVLAVLAVIAGIAGQDDADDTTAAERTTTSVASTVETTVPPETTAPATPTTGPVSHSTNTENPPEADVTVAGCGPDEFGFGWVADLVIVNNSREPSSYLVTVSGLDASGVVIGQGYGTVAGIQPGQTAQVEALGTGDGVATCTLAIVDRFAT